jgi:hypothetical protein
MYFPANNIWTSVYETWYKMFCVVAVNIMFLHLLQFYDSLYSHYQRTFHATSEPEVVRSTSNTMAVIFISYHNVGHRGFRARYTSDELSRMYSWTCFPNQNRVLSNVSVIVQLHVWYCLYDWWNFSMYVVFFTLKLTEQIGMDLYLESTQFKYRREYQLSWLRFRVTFRSQTREFPKRYLN